MNLKLFALEIGPKTSPSEIVKNNYWYLGERASFMQWHEDFLGLHAFIFFSGNWLVLFRPLSSSCWKILWFLLLFTFVWSPFQKLKKLVCFVHCDFDIVFFDFIMKQGKKIKLIATILPYSLRTLLLVSIKSSNPVFRYYRYLM